MKFKIYNGVEEEEKIVYLKLHQRDNGDIQLLACDGFGQRDPNGSILRITSIGELALSTYVGQDLGLQLDENRCIVIKRR